MLDERVQRSRGGSAEVECGNMEGAQRRRDDLALLHAAHVATALDVRPRPVCLRPRPGCHRRSERDMAGHRPDVDAPERRGRHSSSRMQRRRRPHSPTHGHHDWVHCPRSLAGHHSNRDPTSDVNAAARAALAGRDWGTYIQNRATGC